MIVDAIILVVSGALLLGGCRLLWSATSEAWKARR